MLVDLVQTTTSDGVRLDGSYQAAPTGAATPAGGSRRCDAVLAIHGTGGAFFSSTLFDRLGARLLAESISLLRVNTRGHGLVNTVATSQGPRRQGAAYEALHECRLDVTAWVDWLVARGARRVGLLGHSSGAVKCLFAQAFEPHPAVCGVMAISPPRLSHAWFAAGPQGNAFLDQFTAAEALVASGHGDTLLDVKFPLPYLITAAGYVEKYGPDERYNFVQFLGRVRVPTLVTFGSIEVDKNVAFHALPEAVAVIGADRPTGRTIDVAVIPEADHFYSAAHAELADVVARWLQQ